jgi:hypothetical protein
MMASMGTIKVEHVSASSAHVALQAAATVYSGGRDYSGHQVTALADVFLDWLDAQDAMPE